MLLMDLEQIAKELPGLKRQLEQADRLATEKLRAARDAEKAAHDAVAARDALLKVVEGIEGWASATGASNGAPVEQEMVDGEIVEVVRTTPRKIIRGREAVRRILREHGRVMRQRDLVAEVIARGWIDPESRDPGAAIRVAARRLVDDGEVIKVADGLYRYKLPSGTPDGGDAADAARQSQLLDEEAG
jgi:hypothetical protein